MIYVVDFLVIINALLVCLFTYDTWETNASRFLPSICSIALLALIFIGRILFRRYYPSIQFFICLGSLMFTFNVAVFQYKKATLTYSSGVFEPQTLHEFFYHRLDVGEYSYVRQKITNPYTSKHLKQFVVDKIMPENDLVNSVLHSIVSEPTEELSELHSLILENAKDEHLDTMYYVACQRHQNFQTFNKKVIQDSFKKFNDETKSCHRYLKKEVLDV